MQFDFASVIAALNAGLPFGDNFSFRNARSRVIPGEYLLNTILPQEQKVSYHISGGSMRIYPTMLGQVPMDTPYPPMGALESSSFNENTTKLAGQMHFPEERLRELQEFAAFARSQGISDGLTIGAIQALEKERVVRTVLGFSDLMLKAQWDTYEWMRGQALSNGRIDWKFETMDLSVDYGIPAKNMITRSGAASYHDSSSAFWADIRKVYQTLSNFQIIMNSKTYYSIIDNPNNAIEVLNSDGQVREFVKIVGTTERRASDVRDRVRVVLYDKSASVINKGGKISALPIIPDGKIIIIGETEPDGIELLIGSTPDPDNRLRLGYTHIAPTVEGGRPGFWSRVFTPEAKPYQLMAETASNGLPVITNPNKVMILTTGMPA